jgi:predicted signal transduction protein with EAL and GGDEF domain
MTPRLVADAPQNTQQGAAILHGRKVVLELVENRNTAENAAAIAAGLLTRFRTAFLIAGRHHQPASTIGNSVCPMDAGEPEQLLEFAGMAMHHACAHAAPWRESRVLFR